MTALTVVNYSFEDRAGDVHFSPSMTLGKGWHPYWRNQQGKHEIPWDRGNETGYQAPEFKLAEKPDPSVKVKIPRWHTGDRAQQWFGFLRVLHSGIYQVISCPKDATVHGSAWVHAWSNGLPGQNLDNPKWSDGVGLGAMCERVPEGWPEKPVPTGDPFIDARYNVGFRIGISPTSKTNPLADDFVWSGYFSIYNVFAQIITPSVKVNGEFFTLAIEARSRWGFKHNDVYVDDVEAELVSTPSEIPGVNYVVVVHLLPPDVTPAEFSIVVTRAYPNRQTVVFSADDAARLVAPGLLGSKVIVWQYNRWSDDIVKWLEARGVSLIDVRSF